MEAREQLYLRCLMLLHVRINNETSLGTVSPGGKPCRPYPHTDKAEGGSGGLCASQKRLPELI